MRRSLARSVLSAYVLLFPSFASYAQHYVPPASPTQTTPPVQMVPPPAQTPPPTQTPTATLFDFWFYSNQTTGFLSAAKSSHPGVTV